MKINVNKIRHKQGYGIQKKEVKEDRIEKEDTLEVKTKILLNKKKSLHRSFRVCTQLSWYS